MKNSQMIEDMVNIAGVSRTDATMVFEIADHAAKEALRSLVARSDTMPRHLRVHTTALSVMMLGQLIQSVQRELVSDMIKEMTAKVNE